MSLLSSALLAAAVGLCSVDSAPQRAVVVELFTSQGCSSCPPADRWLGTLRDRHGERVIPLSMHVGYWDYIGWKDPFARVEFNERQRLLAAGNGSRTVYTPGVFVQGRELRDWNRAGRFDALVRAAQQSPAAARVSLAVEAVKPRSIEVHVRSEAPRGSRLWLALLQSGLTTVVRAGENRGETLRNDHVVRAWHGPHAIGDARLSLDVPADSEVSQGGWAVVGLVDDPGGRTLQAVRLPLSACAAIPPR